MNIAVIGAGNVGGALAGGLARAGHQIFLGVRDVADAKARALAEHYETMSLHPTSEAAAAAETIIIAASPQATKTIAEQLGDVSEKVIIDAMNSVFAKPEPYATTTDALLAWTNVRDIAKCFNTTGYENMIDPVYAGKGIDMFVAGDSQRAKDVAATLARDIGFGACHDFGGADTFALLEQFAMSWINLALKQGHGRDIAFRLVRR